MTVSSNDFDPESAIPFLSEHFFKESNKILKLPDEISEAFYKALTLMRGNTELRRMARESHRKQYCSGGLEEHEELIWPEHSMLESLMGDQAGMFAAVVLISGLPKTIERYQSKGIPMDVLVETMSDVEVWIRDYRNKQGVWGFDNVDWLKHHLAGRLFRLGRLQFISDPLHYKIHVFRNTFSGEVIAFPSTGIHYRSDGQMDGTNDSYVSEGGWMSSFEVTEKEIIGTPLSSSGYAHHKTLRLPKTQWRPVLAEGDTVLHIHIAEGSKMTHELCRESYRKALEFYPKYFPEKPFSAFACGSWLLSPQFQQLLPDSSNIVRFQKDLYLFSILSQDHWTLSRVFGERQIDPATAPRDTMLRRAILDHMAQGHRMYSGAGFILREDAGNGSFAQNYLRLSF
jgi:hypothetical protein